MKLNLSRFKQRMKETPAYLKAVWVSFNRAQKILVRLIFLLIATTLTMRAVALKYQLSERSKPEEFGTTFVSEYAEHFGLDSKQTFNAIVDDLNIKNLRLVSYWSTAEKEKGTYDFADLDWQFSEAEKKGVKVSLAIGLRQPRWPECHQPQWSKNLPKEEWYPSLKAYMSEVIKRYKDSPALESYQLENEFFLEDFGICPDFSRDRLIDEFNLVKSLDSKTPIILSRSNNYGGFAVGEPQADIHAISVYRKVHNKTLGYITYPFPAWYYAFLAGGQKMITGKPSIIHEFQLEPWIKSGDIKDASIEEQNKTMSQEDIRANIDFARITGIKEVYFWGAEWWYWRLQNGDPTIWNTVKENLY
jgi:hypothetical protein